jgi:hypothetical protein
MRPLRSRVVKNARQILRRETGQLPSRLSGRFHMYVYRVYQELCCYHAAADTLGRLIPHLQRLLCVEPLQGRKLSISPLRGFCSFSLRDAALVSNPCTALHG